MKKIIIPIMALILITGSSCQEKTELTEEQKGIINNKVTNQFNNLLKASDQLNIDMWSANFSKKMFISAISESAYYPSLESLVNSTASVFSHTVVQQSELLDLNVTPLTNELAQMTAIINTVWEEGREVYDSAKVFNTLIWKKEDESWKIINLHRSYHFYNPIGQAPSVKQIYVSPDSAYMQ